MRDMLKLILIPLMIAGGILCVVSGCSLAIQLVKLGWNLIFHEVTRQMLVKLLYTFLVFIICGAILLLADKVD